MSEMQTSFSKLLSHNVDNDNDGSQKITINNIMLYSFILETINSAAQENVERKK